MNRRTTLNIRPFNHKSRGTGFVLYGRARGAIVRLYDQDRRVLEAARTLYHLNAPDPTAVLSPPARELAFKIWRLPKLDKGGQGQFSDFVEISYSVALRFWHRLRRAEDGDCLIWTGPVDGKGYGFIKIEGKVERVHRVAWILSGRLIDQNNPYLLHGCDVSLCCNPLHLRTGTHQENQRDKSIRGRGVRSSRGLPFGVKSKRQKFEASARIDGRLTYLGTFEDWQHAAAIATFKKNLSLYGAGVL